MELNPELIQVLQMVAPSLAAWGAIRADIKNLASNVLRAESSVAKAHQRLDEHIEKHHTVR